MFDPLDSKYARVLNMLGLYAWFWRKFSVFDIWQGSVHALSSECVSVTQGFCNKWNILYVDRVLSIPWILTMLGLEYTRVVNMPRLRRVLRELYLIDSRLFWTSWVLKMLRFWIYQESKYAILTKGSEWSTSSYIFAGFWI